LMYAHTHTRAHTHEDSRGVNARSVRAQAFNLCTKDAVLLWCESCGPFPLTGKPCTHTLHTHLSCPRPFARPPRCPSQPRRPEPIRARAARTDATW
jgi:hypothetical protein